jgi:hypothetical protein
MSSTVWQVEDVSVTSRISSDAIVVSRGWELVWRVFAADLGLADERLVRYIDALLGRVMRLQNLVALDALRCGDVALADLVGLTVGVAADKTRSGDTSRREMYQSIGDTCLFWCGMFPEALQGRLIEMIEQGKRAYYIASTYVDELGQDEAELLRRISNEFELCTVGITQVRKEWNPRSSAVTRVHRRLLFN